MFARAIPRRRKILRADIESAPTVRLKAPLEGSSREAGEGWLGEVRAPGATPHRLTAELPSRGATLYTRYFGPEGVNMGRVQSAVKKMQSLLHF